MAKIEIDGKIIEAQSGSMIIEAADAAGIYIPRFCYHKKLSIAANCRMCLVEVEKSGKPLPACATPISDGMRVFTRSKEAIHSQKTVMQFLLINHPLDCPICDQGGECELQDLSMGFGSDVSEFTEGKRSIADEDLGPLISTEMTRCIHCTRCVRFGQEVAGLRELGLIGRGEHTEISTYVKHSVESELSGNIIDLCPVGALTSKPFRFKARAWEMLERPTIAPHDCVGSNLNVHVLRNKVMRAVPKENEAINETWISDRDRFSYEGIRQDRLEYPMIKREGKWEEITWQQALDSFASHLKQIIEKEGAKQIAALAHPSSTTEEFYLLQKMMRSLGSDNIDHRIRHLDFADDACASAYPGFEDFTLQDIDEQQAILLVGTNIREEAPIAAHRVRKAQLQDAKICIINPVDYPFKFEIAEKIIMNPVNLTNELASVAKALLEKNDAAKIDEKIKETLKTVKINDKAKHIADLLFASEKATIILGAIAEHHPDAASIRALARTVAMLANAKVGILTDGANSAGAWLAGAIPKNKGLHALSAIQKQLKAYLLLGLEPALDFVNASNAQEKLTKAEFVVAMTAFKSDHLMQCADLLLPIAPFTETPGTFVNVQGDWQSFMAVSLPLGQAKPAWKVLRVMGNYLNCDGFDFTTSQEVLAEVKEQVSDKKAKLFTDIKLITNRDKVVCLNEWLLYQVDSLVRRAKPLQECASKKPLAAYMNATCISKHGLENKVKCRLKQGSDEVILDLIEDNAIADECVFIPAGYRQTAALTDSFNIINIEKE